MSADSVHAVQAQRTREILRQLDLTAQDLRESRELRELVSLAARIPEAHRSAYAYVLLHLARSWGAK